MFKYRLRPDVLAALADCFLWLRPYFYDRLRPDNFLVASANIFSGLGQTFFPRLMSVCMFKLPAWLKISAIFFPVRGTDKFSLIVQIGKMAQ